MNQTNKRIDHATKMFLKLATVLVALPILGGFTTSPTAWAQDSVNGETSNGKQELEKAADESLGSQLKAMADASIKRFPSAMLQTMEDAIDEVRESDLVETALKKGDQAIDATLKNSDGESVTLSKEWNSGPVILMWYRGGWCPYCNIQLQAMNRRIKQWNSVGAKLIVVSPELPEKSKETAAKNSLQVQVLHDPQNQLAAKYGLVFTLPEALQPLYRDQLGLAKYNGDDSMQLPLAATYVIDSKGKIQYSFLDEDYKKRAEPDDIMAAVRTISGPPKSGQVADNFSLPSIQGEMVSLNQKLSSGPAVVVMLRGFPGYQCPICSRQVANLIRNAKSFQDANASVLLVYPGPLEQNPLNQKATEFLKGTKLPDNFHVLLDSNYSMTNLYGLRWDAPRETAYPATFVIGADGTVNYAKVSDSHGGRADTEEVITALKK